MLLIGTHGGTAGAEGNTGWGYSTVHHASAALKGLMDLRQVWVGAGVEAAFGGHLEPVCARGPGCFEATTWIVCPDSAPICTIKVEEEC